MRPLSRVSFVLALAAVVAGCVSGGGRSVPLFGEPEGKLLLQIQVQNNNFNDATLHAIWNGSRRRLGTVTGKSKATYTLEWTTSNPLQLEIDFLAGGVCTTQAITANPGETLDLIIGLDSNACDATD